MAPFGRPGPQASLGVIENSTLIRRAGPLGLVPSLARCRVPLTLPPQAVQVDLPLAHGDNSLSQQVQPSNLPSSSPIVAPSRRAKGRYRVLAVLLVLPTASGYVREAGG